MTISAITRRSVEALTSCGYGISVGRETVRRLASSDRTAAVWEDVFFRRSDFLTARPGRAGSLAACFRVWTAMPYCPLATGRPCSDDARRTLQGLPKRLLGPESGLAIGAWKVGSYSSYKIRKFCAIVIAPAEVGAEHRQGEVVTGPAGAI